MDESETAVNTVIVAAEGENGGEIVTAGNLNFENVTQTYTTDGQQLVISTVSHDHHEVANLESEESVIVTTSDHDYAPDGSVIEPHIVILSEALNAIENQGSGKSQEAVPVSMTTVKHAGHEGKTVEEITNEIISIISESGGMVTMVPYSNNEHSYSQNTGIDASRGEHEVVIQDAEVDHTGSYEGTVQTITFQDSESYLDNTVKKLKKSVNANKISPADESDEKLTQKSPKEKSKSEQKVFKVYRCGQCSKSFYDTESYLEHLPNHEDQNSFECLICQKKLSGILKLKRHMMLHDSEFKCDICGKMFLKEKNLILHKNLHSKKMFKCSKCKKKFFRLGDLKNHMVSHSNSKTYKCEECEEVFDRHDSYLWHKNGHKDEVMKCETCDDIITSLNSLRHHLKLHKNDLKENGEDIDIQDEEDQDGSLYTCQYCNETFMKYKEFTKHLDEHREQEAYSCSKCNKKFSMYASLYKHKLRCENTTRYLCTQCDKVFKYQKTLEVHMNSHNGIIFTCEEPDCNKEFKTKQGLYIHMKIHAGTAHQCNICGKMSTSRTNHEEHMMIHSGEKPHVCTTCGKGFIQKRKLKEHMFTHQGRKRPRDKMFQCSICGHEYSSKKAMIEHTRDHTGDMPYECKVCGMKFSRQTGYRNHMNRHEDKRNFRCKECGRGFNYNSNLKAHMVVHSGVKPFKCDICPKAYTRAAELRHHQATVHEGKNLNKFFCKFCNKGFSHVTNLRHHVYTHTGEKPYKCHMCEAAFTTNQSLKFHKKKVHSLTEPESGHKIGKYKDPENLEKGLQCNFSSDEDNEVEVYTQAIDEEIESATVKVQEINDENVIYLNLSDLDDAESFIAIIETPMEIQTSQ